MVLTHNGRREYCSYLSCPRTKKGGGGGGRRGEGGGGGGGGERREGRVEKQQYKKAMKTRILMKTTMTKPNMIGNKRKYKIKIEKKEKKERDVHITLGGGNLIRSKRERRD